METPDVLQATWCQKLDETTEVILEKENTTWKLWTTVIKDGINHRFKFVVKQHTGPAKCAVFKINTCQEWSNGCELKFSNLMKTAEYLWLPSLSNEHQIVISADLVITDAHRVKKAEQKTSDDYLITIGNKTFAINRSVSETLDRRFGASFGGVFLVGVDYDDFITLIDNQTSIETDLTVEKIRKYHMMQTKYGIRHSSEKIEKMMEMDFWENSDGIEYHKVNEVERPHKTAPEMTISKKYRIPSLPNKYTINALGMKLDVYFYIQEYNGTSYVSIGVISDSNDISTQSNDNDKEKYWSETIVLNILLHHGHNPQFSKSVEIAREFNTYQRSAGCPTFMLSSELSDFCLKDGSFIVTISLSPTDNTSDLPYPGTKDVILSCNDKKFNVSRDLLLHYCQSFRTSASSDILSADNIPLDILIIFLDLIYHRSNSQIIEKIQKVLEFSKTIQCQFFYDHVDRLLANHCRYELNLDEQTLDTRDLHDCLDLPLLREAERFSGDNLLSWDQRVKDPVAYPSKLPSDARILRPLTVNRLLDIILPLKVFKKKNERARLCGKFHSENGLLKLRKYRMALCTLEGVPQELRMDLKDAYQEIRKGQDHQGQSVGDGLEAFERLLGDGGFKELKETAKKERKIVQDARAELVVLKNRRRTSPRTKSFIDEIVLRNEEHCMEGRRKAAKMFVEKLRKEEGRGKEEKKENGSVMDEIRNWAQYLGTLATLQF